MADKEVTEARRQARKKKHIQKRKGRLAQAACACRCNWPQEKEDDERR